ncbi:hypothetical protein OH77DRAFT_1475125, partial [Trametes cingulata]
MCSNVDSEHLNRTLLEGCTLAESQPARTAAAAPFDEGGDIVLRSDFHAYRWIIAAASPVFADMFSLPQLARGTAGLDIDRDADMRGDGNGDGESTKVSTLGPREDGDRSDTQVVQMTEDSNTLETLLRGIYPCPPALHFASLDALKPVASAAHKYQLDYLASALLPPLHTFSRAEPVRVYAWAVRFDMASTAERAARDFLRIGDPWRYAGELAHISARAYHALLEYRRRCR